jgi:hypothetical protein
MKNIYLLPTTRPSKLYKQANELKLRFIADSPIDSDISINQHIYITSDEEIKEGDWKYCLNDDVIKIQKQGGSFVDKDEFKIILTTDQTRIKDGVQAIDDEFLHWFVKNPSCEKVKIETIWVAGNSEEDLYSYKPVIPQEEPKQEYKPNSCDIIFETAALIENKQETLEEAAERLLKDNLVTPYEKPSFKNGFIEGARWQAERMHTDEEVIDLLQEMNDCPTIFDGRIDIREWFEQFKKK